MPATNAVPSAQSKDGVCGLCQSTSILGCYKPSPSDPCVANGSTHCGLYGKVCKLEQVIEATHRTLLRLVNEHRTLMTEMNKQHDRFESLPSEVASYILSLAFPPASLESNQSIRARVSARSFPLILGEVCHRWRQIAWSTPELWSTVYFYSARDLSDQQNQVGIASEWISRSGQLPLAIRMYTPEKLAYERHMAKLSSPVLDIIRGVSRRWSIVQLYVTPYILARLFSDGYEHPLEPLRYLGIESHKLWSVPKNRYSLPKSVRLRLIGSGIANRNSKELPETERLAISDTPMHEILDILYHARNLHFARFENCLATHPSITQLHTTPIVLPNLKEMVVGSWAVQILNDTTAPFLEKLMITSDFFPVSMIESFLDRGSPSHLKYLAVYGSDVFVDRDEFLQFLQSLEQLSFLDIDHTILLRLRGDPIDSYVDNQFLHSIGQRLYTPPNSSSSLPFLCNLERFIYRGPSHFLWESIPPLFTSNRDPPHKPLRVRIDIKLRWDKTDKRPSVESLLIDPETARKLYEVDYDRLCISIVSGKTVIEDLIGESYIVEETEVS